MKFLFLIDEPQKIKVAKDTSFAFMESAYLRKHQIYYLPRGGISLRNNKVYFRVKEATPNRAAKNFLKLGAEKIFTAEQVDAVFVRLEPPFSQDYLNHTWLLDLAKKSCFIINDPSGIRAANEKIWASQFADLIPKTIISRHYQDCYDFLKDQKIAIAKPLDGFGGSSIFLLKVEDSNSKVALEVISKNFTEEIMLQTYLPEAKKEDKRILLLNGEILGSFVKINSSTDHRNNLAAGGKAEITKVTASDKKIAKRLSPFLKKFGLYFVGLDVIGSCLIEVNVTSPTGIQEASRLTGNNLAAEVLKFVENKVKNFKN